MINPKTPAAVISDNTEVSQAIADTLYGALGVIAGSQGTMIILFMAMTAIKIMKRFAAARVRAMVLMGPAQCTAI